GEDVDPLSPDNVLVIGTGLLTGTLAPSSSRFNVTAKSPESGILGDANCGGFFGAELRYAGFDRLIILGRAKKPVYLYVNNVKGGGIEIRDAESYWGKDTTEVQKLFRSNFGQCEMLVCGVAGENLVRFACVRTGVKNAAGRCGMGAVMGSKNLKAIVASGSEGIKIKHPEQMQKLVEELKHYLFSSKITAILGKVGTPLLYEVSNAIGAIRTKNSQLNAWSDGLNSDEIEKYVEKMVACSSCMIHCRHRNTLGGEGPEYTAVGLLGANLGIETAKEVIELNNLCNELGLDISSSGTIIGWAYELFERGIINKETTGGLELRFGDLELTKKLLWMISRREGFGDILAESVQAVKVFGESAKDYLIAVKGLPQSDPHDVRYIKAFALGIATASRGADHLRSRPTLEIFRKLPQEVRQKIYGTVNQDPTVLDEKEKTVYFSENIFAVIDSLGICKFICHGFNSPHFLNYTHFKNLIYTATGWEFDEEELRGIGCRIVDLERLFNIKQGLTREDDTLPKRYFDDPMPLKIAKGHCVDRQDFVQALDRYYKLRDWTEDGRLKQERIKEITDY
ncbi:MAG: aldehyde ferredoxin oxidoreductase family protein, partial [Planctomycetota bacterium]|nr:aldehyde ferredoxin oxidoreductase family protein [Planctomycetota bacterium]MDI6787213.1 aldehyde ferredoxin oxidoreductase family protein [Planctomycetota bacterium]